MSLTSILQVGLSGVLASENALQTVSNNITNENTPSYVRETAILSENASQPKAYGSLGAGVGTQSIQRNFSSYAENQVLNATSLATTFSGQANTLRTLSSLFPVGFTQSGLPAAIQAFFASVQTLSTNPSSIPNRQSVLSQAGSLAAQYQNATTSISNTQTSLVQQMQQSVSTINGLSTQLASINQEILKNPKGAQVPNSLLDQQSAALTSLAGQVGISTIQQPNGTLIVATKSGATLVDGSQSLQLRVQTGGTYQQAGQAGIIYQPTGQVLTSKITGGQLGGAITAQQQVNTIQLQFGLLAQGIAAVTNTQQAQGVDLNGNIGRPMFAVSGPQVFPAGSNSGSAIVSATITDLSATPPTTFTLEYNGSQWNVTNDGTGSTTAMTASGGQLAFGGMTVGISGTPATGDSYLVNPVGSTAGSFRVVMTNPNQVAAAAPYVASAGSLKNGGLVNTNAGTETLSSGMVLAPSGSAASGAAVIASGFFGQPLAVTFSGGTQFNVTTSGGAFVASGTWSASGTTALEVQYPSNSLASGSAFVFSWAGGTPASGDTFTLSSGAPGSNANAVSMSQAASLPALSAGSLNQFTADMSNSYGNLLQGVNQGGAVAQTTLTQAKTALSNISGVNLNAEAALVVSYTQAYQAASAVIQTSNTLFQNLLQSI
ncbi:flagellar hook-associated protein FlgK [Acidithiobacillus ferriphilus]|uniref:flagellar hook-associated protein FlgK n=1 Tax=Acidithiobacillus ferriphilus TaxID=1689834 RepID=UPI001C06D61D|nr:flagellar hook-associated protein FlgK [Acidithiobacillus ferriphilus]MBU2847894.1 flagellar hook-associated protein FlgK [Acidithiobacillus ferriphilus]